MEEKPHYEYEYCPPSNLISKCSKVRYLRYVSNRIQRRYRAEGGKVIPSLHKGYYLRHDRSNPSLPMDMIYLEAPSNGAFESQASNPILSYGNTLDWLNSGTATEDNGIVVYERISELPELSVLDLYIAASSDWPGLEELSETVHPEVHQDIWAADRAFQNYRFESGILITRDNGDFSLDHFRITAEKRGVKEPFRLGGAIPEPS